MGHHFVFFTVDVAATSLGQGARLGNMWSVLQGGQYPLKPNQSNDDLKMN